MSIRFSCLSCRTVLKIGEMVTEPRKVRCTGCSIVILVEPDPNDPLAVKTSIPEQNLNKAKSRSEKELARRRKVLYGFGGVLVLGLVAWLTWYYWPPNDRGSIEGSIKLDNEPLEDGKITFISQDGKNVSVSAAISQGRYRLSVYSGPMVGKNKVEIRSEKKTGRTIDKSGEPIDEIVESIPERWHAKSKETIDIKPGANSRDYEIKSK